MPSFETDRIAIESHLASSRRPCDEPRYNLEHLQLNGTGALQTRFVTGGQQSRFLYRFLPLNMASKAPVRATIQGLQKRKVSEIYTAKGRSSEDDI